MQLSITPKKRPSIIGKTIDFHTKNNYRQKSNEGDYNHKQLSLKLTKVFPSGLQRFCSIYFIFLQCQFCFTLRGFFFLLHYENMLRMHWKWKIEGGWELCNGRWKEVDRWVVRWKGKTVIKKVRVQEIY